MLIELDYREHGLIDLFKKSENINYNIINLNIGDVVFKNELGEIILIIERKTFHDLCASIIDNRFAEQKQRLIESGLDVMYIFEGYKNLKLNLPTSTINSSILNLIFKHKFKTMITENIKDTYDILIQLYNKFVNKDFEQNGIKTSLVKKSQKVNENMFINILSSIPGTSIKIAEKINEKYKSIKELIDSFNENGEFMLENIKVTEKRKLGKKLSEKIYNSFCIRPIIKKPE